MASKGAIALPSSQGYLRHDSSEYSADRLPGVVSRVFFCDRCCHNQGARPYRLSCSPIIEFPPRGGLKPIGQREQLECDREALGVTGYG